MTAVRRPVAAALGLLGLLGALAGPAQANIDPTVGDLAGNGTFGFAGDGGPAGAALMRAPSDTAQRADGSILIADTQNGRIREVAANGNINTIAGTGDPCPAPTACGGAGGPKAATAADLAAPTGVTPLAADGTYLITDRGGHAVERVNAAKQLSRYAGNGQAGFAGDGGQAVAARLNNPGDTTVLPDGGVLIADTGNNRVRLVLPDGRITTVAGTGAAGYSGDGGDARSAQLNQPSDVDAAPDGSWYIADTGNNVIRRVTKAGVISTVAGRGDSGEAGDGRPALRALLDRPLAVDALPSGGFIVADTDNDRIRRISAGGTITTEAGTTAGSQTGPGSQAKLRDPSSVTVDNQGRVLFADTGNNRVRALNVTGEPAPANFNSSVVLDPLDGTTTVKSKSGSSLTLNSDENVPIDSVINTTSSEVLLTVEPETTGGIDRTSLSQGPFALRQVTTKTKPITELILKDLPPRCSTKKARAKGSMFEKVARAAASRRRLFTRGRGRFRTRGRYGSGTKRGTEFLTEDRCDGTLFKVREGQIAVRDFVTGKTIIVKAGGRYFARQGKRTVKP